MNELIKQIQKTRKDFTKQTLDESQVSANPVNQFYKWFKDAIDAGLTNPDAMVVATTSKDGKPSARILLLRNFDDEGFVFYTNYNSRKGTQLMHNPYVSLTFFWPDLERQIRVEGLAEKQSEEESDKYFNERPTGSKLGAWASQQSNLVESRDVLEKQFAEIQNRFQGQEIPRPEFWGGYLVKPEMYEFWQGRPNRFHDRIVYKLDKNKSWKIERLSP